MNPDRKKVNHQLKKLGFGGLDDPAIIHQLAFCIRDHEHFRQLLFSAVPAEQRRLAYETMKPHLNFTPKSLDEYRIDMEQQMEREQTPVQMRDGSIIDFKDYHGERPSIEVMAEEAINLAAKGALAKGNYPRVTLSDAPKEGVLTLTCQKCTLEEHFTAADRIAAFAKASAQGWVFIQLEKGKEHAVCAKCAVPALVSA